MNPSAPATTSAQALQNLQAFQSSAKSPEDILNSQEQSLGVPQAQQQVTGLRSAIQNTTNLLNNVAPSVYGRTGNSLETNAQASAEIGNEQAPINTQLDKENTDYSNANTDYTNLLDKANSLASADYTGQQGQEGYLKDIYSALFGQESAAAASALDQQKLAEQAREADLTASTAANSGALSPSLASLLGGSSSSTPATATYGLKVANNPASGYYFRDANGNPINALQYATSTGKTLAQVVAQMASSGDTGAKAVLPFISGNTIKAGILSPALIKDFTG